VAAGLGLDDAARLDHRRDERDRQPRTDPAPHARSLLAAGRS
jgi:hypothetical protein